MGRAEVLDTRECENDTTSPSQEFINNFSAQLQDILVLPEFNWEQWILLNSLWYKKSFLNYIRFKLETILNNKSFSIYVEVDPHRKHIYVHTYIGTIEWDKVKGTTTKLYSILKQFLQYISNNTWLSVQYKFMTRFDSMKSWALDAWKRIFEWDSCETKTFECDGKKYDELQLHKRFFPRKSSVMVVSNNITYENNIKIQVIILECNNKKLIITIKFKYEDFITVECYICWMLYL